ncbi:acyltransferase family protein [Vibrio cholerae]|uniref:acyltransferase family protein n=1 Tax=Vibrio cholerae TaxID=666 RepID=UPI003080854B
MVFRADINGLRAIAVIGVVLFHFNASLSPGGFAGVDVFFVISGFLMTGIIFSGMTKGDEKNGKSFSLLRFYKSRALRIVPALAVLCLVLLVFGWLFLIPLDYKELSKHAAGSITFISNIVYWNEAGYFDSASHQKWLLHTWSLSVEWQFYIIYPLILLALFKLFSIRLAKLFVLLGAVFGFVFCIFATYKWADASYYLLPTRAWQMLAGGVAYLYPISFISKKGVYFQSGGLLLIVCAYAMVAGDQPWPGYLAFIPVLGAFLVIQAQRNDGGILDNILFQKIGLWSYSIYLWHWIVVVFNIKYDVGFGIFSYLAITLTLGWFSYYLVEIRSSIYVLVVFSLALTFSAFVYLTDGVGGRVEQKYQLNKTEFHAKYYGGSGYPANRFFFLNEIDGKQDYVFIGDSYGLQYAKEIDENGYSVAALFDHGCLILPNYSRYINNMEDLNCSAEYDKVRSYMAKTKAPLIMAHSWDTYSKNLVRKGESQALDLSESEYHMLIQKELDNIVSDNGDDRHYFVLGVPQRSKENAFECLARTDLLGFRFLNNCNEKQARVNYKINDVLRAWADRNENTHYIDPNDFLCDESDCLIVKNREPIHSDGAHLSVFGASIVVKGLFSKVDSIIGKEY